MNAVTKEIELLITGVKNLDEIVAWAADYDWPSIALTDGDETNDPRVLDPDVGSTADIAMAFYQDRIDYDQFKAISDAIAAAVTGKA